MESRSHQDGPEANPIRFNDRIAPQHPFCAQPEVVNPTAGIPSLSRCPSSRKLPRALHSARVRVPVIPAKKREKDAEKAASVQHNEKRVSEAHPTVPQGTMY